MLPMTNSNHAHRNNITMMSSKTNSKGCYVNMETKLGRIVWNELNKVIDSFYSQKLISIEAFLSRWEELRMDEFCQRPSSRIDQFQYAQIFYAVCLENMSPDCSLVADSESFALLPKECKAYAINATLLFAIYLFYLRDHSKVRVNKIYLDTIYHFIYMQEEASPDDFYEGVRQSLRWMAQQEAFILASGIGPISRTLDVTSGHLACSISDWNTTALRVALTGAGFELPENGNWMPRALPIAARATIDIQKRRQQIIQRRKEKTDAKTQSYEARTLRLLRKVYASRRRLRESFPSAAPSAASPAAEVLDDLELQISQFARVVGVGEHGLAFRDSDSDSDSGESVDLTTALLARGSASMLRPPSITTTDLASAEEILIDLEQQIDAILSGNNNLDARIPAVGKRPRTPKQPKPRNNRRSSSAVDITDTDDPPPPRAARARALAPRVATAPKVGSSSGSGRGSGGSGGGSADVERMLRDLEAFSQDMLK